MLSDAIPDLQRIYGQARRNHQTPDIDSPKCEFFIEVKRQKRPNILGAYKQASEDSSGSRPVLVLSKADGEPWLVTMDAPTFCRLYQLCKYAMPSEALSSIPTQSNDGDA